MNFWVSISTILANIAVIGGLGFAVFEFVRYRIAKKNPALNCIVTCENNLIPDMFIHTTNIAPAFKGSKMTAFYKWITIFNSNPFGNTIITILGINDVHCFSHNQELFTSEEVIEFEKNEMSFMRLPIKLEPGDTVSGYFPFYGNGHIDFIPKEYLLALTSGFGEPKFTPINIKEAPYKLHKC